MGPPYTILDFPREYDISMQTAFALGRNKVHDRGYCTLPPGDWIECTHRYSSASCGPVACVTPLGLLGCLFVNSCFRVFVCVFVTPFVHVVLRSY